MSALLWRLLIAVISVVLIWALIPPVLRVLGLELSADVARILQLCVAGMAVFYAIKGPPFPP